MSLCYIQTASSFRCIASWLYCRGQSLTEFGQEWPGLLLTGNRGRATGSYNVEGFQSPCLLLLRRQLNATVLLGVFCNFAKLCGRCGLQCNTSNHPIVHEDLWY